MLSSIAAGSVARDREASQRKDENEKREMKGVRMSDVVTTRTYVSAVSKSRTAVYPGVDTVKLPNVDRTRLEGKKNTAATKDQSHVTFSQI